MTMADWLTAEVSAIEVLVFLFSAIVFSLAYRSARKDLKSVDGSFPYCLCYAVVCARGIILGAQIFNLI